MVRRPIARCIALSALMACAASKGESPSVATPAAANVERAVNVERSANFEYFHHLLVVPVRVNDSIEQKFILDTGAGVNLVSEAFCKRIGCKLSGEFVGKRMSGQEVRIPLSTVASLTVASHRVASVPTGVFDMSRIGLDPSIGGFVSLSFFKDVAFTIDYRARKVIIEDVSSLAARRARGTASPVRFSDEKPPALDIFLPMKLADGRTVAMEVDTGSDALILNEPFMGELGITPQSPNVKTVQARDETGNAYVRYFTTIPGPVRVATAPEIQQRDLPVMFQRIIYDGLVGDAFLKQFTVTYDLPHAQMIFARPE